MSTDKLRGTDGYQHSVEVFNINLSIKKICQFLIEIRSSYFAYRYIGEKCYKYIQKPNRSKDIQSLAPSHSIKRAYISS